MPTPRLIIHGGAGAIHPSNLPYETYLLYAASLLEVNRSTTSRLAAGASALDAATEAVRMMEDNPLFNCGKGAVFTREGGVELEASVSFGGIFFLVDGPCWVFGDVLLFLFCSSFLFL